MDVFCDLVYGGGWMDIERGEETDRECNWALIEFKSLPLNKNSTRGGDPRTAATVLLLKSSCRWSIDSSSQKSLEQASLALSVLAVQQIEAVETCCGPAPAIAVSPATQGDSDHTAHSRPGTAGSGNASPARQLERVPSDSPLTPGTTKRRFRIPVPSPSVVRRSTLVPAEYSTVDFETRLASYSDDELNESASMKALTPAEKHARRMSRDDAWVDILVAAHSRRMGSQEAERRPGGKGLKGGRSDPELASQEIALVLAGVRARSPLSDEEEIQPRQPAAE
ncbi:hypothetical protein JVT61DRAFT_6397, partial [Boletus reticuloceps]